MDNLVSCSNVFYNQHVNIMNWRIIEISPLGKHSSHWHFGAVQAGEHARFDIADKTTIGAPYPTPSRQEAR